MERKNPYTGTPMGDQATVIKVDEGRWLPHGRRLRALVVLAAALSGHPAWPQDGGAHLVPMFPAAGDGVRQGFVRVINHSRRDGEVRIQPFDDDGARFGAVTLAIDAD